MNKLVCIVGMTGSGKTEVARFFQKKGGYAYLRFGQVVLDEVMKAGLPVSEASEREFRVSLRQKHGMGAMAILNIPKIDELLKTDNVVADGLYSWDEYKVLKEKYGEQLMVVAVLASPKARYSRLTGRIYNPEADKKAINRPLSAQDARSRDYSEIEETDKGGPIAMADYFLVNEGSRDDLLKKLEDLYKKLNEN